MIGAYLWLDTCFQIHGRKYQHCLIAFVTELGANREYDAADILGQAAKYCRDIAILQYCNTDIALYGYCRQQYCNIAYCIQSKCHLTA